MKTYGFYHKETGVVHSNQFSSDDDSQLVNNIPTDHVAIEGQLDSLSQRVDVATGQVVDYQPSQPSFDHEWNVITKRWQLNAAAQLKISNHNTALSQIDGLEAKGIRAMRELLLTLSPDSAERQRLATVDTEIAKQRPLI